MTQQLKDIRKNLIDYLIKNFNGNENFIKIVNSSVFSSNDNIISDNYKITNNEKIAIIPPLEEVNASYKNNRYQKIKSFHL